MNNNSDRKINSSGYVSAVPSPSPEELQKFYAEQYYQAPKTSSYQEAYDDTEISYKKLKCAAIIHALKQLGREHGKFVDVGAGEGFLLKAASSEGFDVHGLDFSSFGINKFFPELLDRLTVGDVYDGLAKLKAENELFDICSATNVLEHVIDPDRFLSAVSGVMKPDALFVVTVPNDFSIVQNLAIEQKKIDREFWFAPPYHLHFFNTKNLQAYLVERGFRVLDAFSDFPVDFYLLHSGSNYIMDSSKGKEANRARMLLDLLIAEAGLDDYLNYYRAMFNVGVGRCITVIAEKA